MAFSNPAVITSSTSHTHDLQIVQKGGGLHSEQSFGLPGDRQTLDLPGLSNQIADFGDKARYVIDIAEMNPDIEHICNAIVDGLILRLGQSIMGTVTLRGLGTAQISEAPLGGITDIDAQDILIDNLKGALEDFLRQCESIDIQFDRRSMGQLNPDLAITIQRNTGNQTSVTLQTPSGTRRDDSVLLVAGIAA